MGVVYAAYDPELDRKVAVKLLRAEAAARASAAEGRPRLLREAQAIARLSHPNVVAVHDVGTSTTRVFVAMEFVDGDTLGDWLQRAAAQLARGARGVPRGAGAGWRPRTPPASSTATSSPTT